MPRVASLAALLAVILSSGGFAHAESTSAKAIDPTGGGVPHAAYNNGCTAFQAGDYDTAARAFSRALGDGDAALQERAAYNLANTLARRGVALKEKKDKIAEWKNAIQHYDQALRLNSKHADAAHNRGLVEQAIAALEKEPPKQDQQKQDKKDDQNKEDEKKDDQNKDGQGKDQQNKDEQKKDDQGKQEQQNGGQEQEKNGQEQKEQNAGGKKDEQGKQENGQPQPGEKTDPKDMQPQQGDQPQGQPKTGDIQPANPGEPGDKKDQQAAEAAEAAAAALEGRMTEKDAKQLLESLRQYDVRGRLTDPQQFKKPRPRDFKNW
jgi:Ca-activated chloride channel family protein